MSYTDVDNKFIKFALNYYGEDKQSLKQLNKMVDGKKDINEIIKQFPGGFTKFSENITKKLKDKHNVKNKPNKIIDASKTELIRTCIRQGNEEKIKKLVPDYDDNEELKNIVSDFKEINKKSNVVKRGPYNKVGKVEYFFITLCPFNNSIQDLINIMDRLMKRNHYFNICSYVFEQRGDKVDNMGDGGHIHILCNKLIEKSTMIKQIFKSIHKFCNKESIDIKIVPESDRNKVELYMQGHKTPDKMAKVRIDILWRNNNNVDNIFCIDGKTILRPLEFKHEKGEHEIFYIGDKKYIQFIFNGEKKLLEF